MITGFTQHQTQCFARLLPRQIKEDSAEQLAPELAPTLLSIDRWSNLVINPAYDAGILKLLGADAS